MAYLTIITGSHEFSDRFGRFTRAYARNPMYDYEVDGINFKKRRFDRVIINEDGELIFLPEIISPPIGNKVFSVIQTMGSGKTILGMEHLARVHKIGGNTGANMSVEWFKHNLDKPKEDWTPSLNSMNDLEIAKNITLLFDDIKKTISKWQAKEADMVSSIVNASRKESVNIVFTTQRVINFVPPNIREVANNYEVPYITIRDMRRESPDKMGMPLEMEVFNISANGVFENFGLFTGMFVDGKTICPTERLLNSYSTLELAQDLGSGGGSTIKNGKEVAVEPKTPSYNGYDLEKYVCDELSKRDVGVVHLAAVNREHEADIEVIKSNGKKVLVDAVSCYQRTDKDHKNSYRLRTHHKDFKVKLRNAVQGGYKIYLAFTFKHSLQFLNYNAIPIVVGDVTYPKKLQNRSQTATQLFGMPKVDMW